MIGINDVIVVFSQVITQTGFSLIVVQPFLIQPNIQIWNSKCHINTLISINIITPSAESKILRSKVCSVESVQSNIWLGII